jgi:hypothetical protein
MRRRTFTTMLAGLACTIAVYGPLLAQAQAPKGGSPAEARAMLERAVQALRADKQKALTAFTHGTKGFSQRDLYVFCFGPDGKLDAHPNPAMKKGEVAGMSPDRPLPLPRPLPGCLLLETHQGGIPPYLPPFSRRFFTGVMKGWDNRRCQPTYSQFAAFQNPPVLP